MSKFKPPWVKYVPPPFGPSLNEIEKRKDDFYHTRAWRSQASFKRSISPICEVCEKNGKTTLARMVHHVVSVRECITNNRYDLLLDMGNLQSVCYSCHGVLTNEELRRNQL